MKRQKSAFAVNAFDTLLSSLSPNGVAYVFPAYPTGFYIVAITYGSGKHFFARLRNGEDGRLSTMKRMARSLRR